MILYVKRERIVKMEFSWMAYLYPIRISGFPDIILFHFLIILLPQIDLLLFLDS
jgi:hypothetical protein